MPTAPNLPPPRPTMHGPEGQCAAANAAMRRAEEAYARADSALAAHHSVYEALGRMTGEMSSMRGEVKNLSYRVSRIGSRANDSKHEIDELKEETSQVHNLKDLTRTLKARLDASEQAAKSYRRILVNVLVGVAIIIIAAALAKAFHLTLVGSTEDHHVLVARTSTLGLEAHGAHALPNRSGGV